MMLSILHALTIRPILHNAPPLADSLPKTGVVDVRMLCDSVLVIHYRDGYVIHHQIGQKRSDERVILDHPLNTTVAGDASAYRISSPDDGAFSGGIRPVQVFRKSKGTDFAWFVDSWVNNEAVNTRPDYAAEHWLYLTLPAPLHMGKSYRVQAPGLGIDSTVSLARVGALSDAIHVNLLGYRPDAPGKYGYLYAWQGDGGSLDVVPYVGRSFALVDTVTGHAAFTGRVTFRKGRANAETGLATDTPEGNFLDADVADCDFSAFSTPGSYYLRIDGVGRSEEFAIGLEVYREAFRTSMKGLLGNRSGIDLKPPYVPYVRPAPHNPLKTPGFAGKLKYTKSRYLDRSNPDSSPADKPAVEQGIVGDLTVSGWYQDAGDWDSYPTHIQVPQHLMLAYLLAPANFTSGELHLPEGGGPLPDILKEAGWLPRFCYRLRHELLAKHYGSGGIGLRICGDYFGGDTGPRDVGQGSWQDVDRIWTASGEDPVSTFGYAAVAANFALCLRQAGVADPEGIDWKKEAVESFEWAQTHSHPGDEKAPDYKGYRIYALAALALLTGEASYNSLLLEATSDLTPQTHLNGSDLDGPALYLTASSAHKDAKILDRMKSAVLAMADAEVDSADKRALRWGGDWYMPMLVGQQTTPMVEALAVARVATRTTDPARSRRYFGALCTTADYFLGTNPLHQTWVTGLGPRSPENIFHLDDWYETGVHPRPGVTPYGPWRKDHDHGQGPWDLDWANKSVYPPIDRWPGAERWFSNRCCPMTGEFTVWQNIAPSAFTYGVLCGSSDK
jgi:hypothetical protein